MKLYCYSDPSHAWIKVSFKLLNELGIADHISKFSYRFGGFAYLEEDSDYSTFVKAMKKAGKTFSLIEKHTNKQSRIRRYESYETYRDQFNEDFHYNIPLGELDLIELSEDKEFYIVHIKGKVLEGFRNFGDKAGPSVLKFKSTKTITYKSPYLEIK